MSKVEEYRKQAAECRKLASRMTEGKTRDHLLRMAESWERLAADVEDELNEPELPLPATKRSE
jgi:hypothetical protein